LLSKKVLAVVVLADVGVMLAAVALVDVGVVALRDVAVMPAAFETPLPLIDLAAGVGWVLPTVPETVVMPGVIMLGVVMPGVAIPGVAPVALCVPCNCGV
jgi:hypothetical protein